MLLRVSHVLQLWRPWGSTRLALGDLGDTFVVQFQTKKMKNRGKISTRSKVLEQKLHGKSEQLSKCDESVELT